MTEPSPTERPQTKLYLITPPRIDDETAFIETLKAVLETGHVTALQIRLKRDDGKTRDLEALRTIAPKITPIAQDFGTAVFINDCPELVHRTNADGVHIGQQDMPVKQARDLLGPDAIIGVTCHDSRHLAMQAGEDGADYVAFGAFYPTATKDASTRAEPDILNWWQELMELPCVAIGGITVDNAPPLIAAGADFLAVSAGVWQHKDGPVAAVEAFAAVLG